MGWAVQPGERTVQGELEAALATVLRAPVSLTVAGRTDRGVHALGQVCSYEGELPGGRVLLPGGRAPGLALGQRGAAGRDGGAGGRGDAGCFPRPPRRAL